MQVLGQSVSLIPGERDVFVRTRKLLIAREGLFGYWKLDVALLSCLARYLIAASLLQLEHLNGTDCRHSLVQGFKNLRRARSSSRLRDARTRMCRTIVPEMCDEKPSGSA
jgi:hypothetical protein